MKITSRQELREKLVGSLKESLVELDELLLCVNEHWNYEDGVYRFYHQSFKVYYLQNKTYTMVAALQKLLPDQELNQSFMTIIQEGTGKTFEMDHNQEWMKHTRPMVESFMHARFFLEMACKYGREFKEQDIDMPQLLPSGFAALLYLFNLR